MEMSQAMQNDLMLIAQMSSEINTKADVVTAYYKQIEAALNEGGAHIYAEIAVNPGHADALLLKWTRLQDAWRLVVEQSGHGERVEDAPLLQANRRIRIMVAPHLERLVHKVSQNTADLLRKIRQEAR